MVVDGQGIPSLAPRLHPSRKRRRAERVRVGVNLGSPSPAEVNQLEPTLAVVAVPPAGLGRPRQKPQRVIADKAYASDPFRASSARRGIEPTPARTAGAGCAVSAQSEEAAHPGWAQVAPSSRRWKVERTFAWLSNFHGLLVHWERHLTMHLAFFYLACLLINLRRL